MLEPSTQEAQVSAGSGLPRQSSFFWAANCRGMIGDLLLDSFFGPFDEVNRAMRREFQLLVMLQNQLLARHVRSRAYCLTVLNLCLPGKGL